MIAQIALVRHGETEWNRQRRIQGRTDRPLNAAGLRQATAAGELLAGIAPEPGWAAVLSSPLSRARATAAGIGRVLGSSDAGQLSDLVERDYGSAEGRTVIEAETRWPGLDVPDAEPLAVLATRGLGVLTRLLDEHPNSVAVSHGALLRAGLSSITGSPVPRLENGSVWVLERDAAGRCRVSEIHHPRVPD